MNMPEKETINEEENKQQGQPVAYTDENIRHLSDM